MARVPSNTPRRTRVKAERAPTTPDPIEIAMEAEASGAAPTGVAYQLLANQNRLVQADLKHRGWEIADRRAAFGLKVLLGLGGLAASLFVALMAWQASRASGIVVLPFDTAPSLAARGLSGQATAASLADFLKS